MLLLKNCPFVVVVIMTIITTTTTNSGQCFDNKTVVLLFVVSCRCLLRLGTVAVASTSADVVAFTVVIIVTGVVL